MLLERRCQALLCVYRYLISGLHIPGGGVEGDSDQPAAQVAERRCKYLISGLHVPGGGVEGDSDQPAAQVR